MALTVDCYRTGKYTVCRHVRVSFSPEKRFTGCGNEGVNRTLWTGTGCEQIEQSASFIVSVPTVDSLTSQFEN